MATSKKARARRTKAEIASDQLARMPFGELNRAIDRLVAKDPETAVFVSQRLQALLAADESQPKPAPAGKVPANDQPRFRPQPPPQVEPPAEPQPMHPMHPAGPH